MIGKTNKSKPGNMDSAHKNLHWKYKLVEKVGYGGQGDIFLVEDALSGKKVILKTADKTHISALKNEYIRLHRLNHYGLPRVFDFHYAGQGAILSMEYCAGESLREIISNKAVDVSKALSIWNNITDILSYIHSQHLIHGDLKPDNIILNKNDIKLLDLGMARRNNSRINNLFIGTAAYAAPEILSGKGDVSQAADIYSLGILVYEMLVGDIPKAEQRLNRDAPWFVSVQKALSGPAAEILMKMLRYSPQERFSSAGALKSAMSETGLFPELSDRRQFEYVSFQSELLEIRNRNIPSKPLMLNGPVGIGKTRLLKELNFINQLNGHYSYYIDGSKPSLLEKTIEFMEPEAYILLDNASENTLDLFNAPDNIKNIKTIFVPANCALLQWQSYPNQVHLKGFSESEYQKMLKLLFVGISSYDLRLLSKWLMQRAGKNLKYARALVRSLTEKGHIVSKGNIWHIKWDKILKEPDLPEEIIKDLEIWWQSLNPEEKPQAIKASMGCLTKEFEVGPYIREKLNTNGDLKVISDNLTLSFVFGKWNETDVKEFINLVSSPDFVWPDFYYCPEVSNLMVKIELWDQWLILTTKLLKKAEDEKNIENSIFFAERLLNSGKLSKQNYDRLATMATDIYCQFGYWESALQLWSNMEKELGSTWRYWRKMFYILINAKRYDRASQIISEIINREQYVTKDIKLLAAIFDGYIKGIGGDFESGRSRIDDCLEQGKTMADSNIIMAGYEMLAMLFYYKSDWNEAIRCFEQAYKYVSKDAEVYELVRMHAAYGMALWRISSYERAKEAILQGVDMLDKDTPNQGLAKMFYALGLLYFDMKKWKYAEECFENCIYHSLGIRDVITLTAAKGGLANVAMKQGRFKWARQIYQELLTDHQIRNDIGGQIGCYSNLGILENLLGNKIQAKEYVALAAEENKINHGCYNQANTLKLKAGIELEQREWGPALQSYFECLKYYFSKSMPADPEVYIELTYAEYKSGNIGEARKFLEKARGTLSQSTMVASRIKGIEGIIMMIEERQRQEGVKKAIEAGEEMINDGDIFYAANCWLRTGEEAVGIGDAGTIKEVMPWLLKAESEFMQMGTPNYLERARETIVKAARVLFQHTRKTVSSDLLNGLYTLAELLSLEGDQKTIAQSALSLAVEMSGAERGALFLLDEKSKIELAAQIDIDDQTYQDAMEYSASAVLSTADGGNVIISNDASVDDAFKSRLSVQRNIIRSLLCVPIRFREGTAGAIYLDSRVTTGLFSYEEKDFVLALSGIIGAVLESKKLMNKLKEKGLGALNKLDELSSSIIGQSSIMQAMVDRIKTIAKADINVLLDGESGSGKEVVAQIIHEFSPRRAEKFLALDCGSLPETLLESELFGYVKGSFTGANKDKVGLFESANGGTVFLDEIASASQAVQSRLLRVLESGEIRRVGDSESRPVDVRVICATNKDLEIEINEGRFREDLYYRLKVVTIPIPPLRERGRDILLLAEYFKEKYQKKFGKIGLKFNPEAKFQLMRYSWPGNVRELENTVQKAVLLTNKKNIGPIDLEIITDLVSNNHQKETDQKQQILEALKSYNNNITHVAKAVGLSRRHLYRLLKKHNIQV